MLCRLYTACKCPAASQQPVYYQKRMRCFSVQTACTAQVGSQPLSRVKMWSGDAVRLRFACDLATFAMMDKHF